MAKEIIIKCMAEEKFIISDESNEVMKKIGQIEKQKMEKVLNKILYGEKKDVFKLSKAEIISIFAALTSIIILGGQLKNHIKANNEITKSENISVNINPQVSQEVQNILNNSKFCEKGKISLKNHEINGNIAKIEYECNKEIKNLKIAKNENSETGTIGMPFPIHPIPTPF